MRFPPFPAGGARYAHVAWSPGHAVSDSGAVLSCVKPNKVRADYREEWRPMVPVRMKGKRYWYVCLKNRGAGRMCKVHRLILECFVGPCPTGMEGCHNDGDPDNNKLSNLRWDTPANNHADKRRHGTTATGDTHGSSKLNSAQVAAIRARLSSGQSGLSIAKAYGVCSSSVYNIRHRRTWVHR